jgi:hypothetical protein
LTAAPSSSGAVTPGHLADEGQAKGRNQPPAQPRGPGAHDQPGQVLHRPHRPGARFDIGRGRRRSVGGAANPGGGGAHQPASRGGSNRTVVWTPPPGVIQSIRQAPAARWARNGCPERRGALGPDDHHLLAALAGNLQFVAGPAHRPAQGEAEAAFPVDRGSAGGGAVEAQPDLGVDGPHARDHGRPVAVEIHRQDQRSTRWRRQGQGSGPGAQLGRPAIRRHRQIALRLHGPLADGHRHAEQPQRVPRWGSPGSRCPAASATA